MRKHKGTYTIYQHVSNNDFLESFFVVEDHDEIEMEDICDPENTKLLHRLKDGLVREQLQKLRDAIDCVLSDNQPLEVN